MSSVEFVKHAKPNEKLEVHGKKNPKNLKRQNLLNMKKKNCQCVCLTPGGTLNYPETESF